MERRRFLSGALGLLAAPAIVRVSSIMPVKVLAPDPDTIWSLTYPSGHSPVGVWYWTRGMGEAEWVPFDPFGD